MDEKDGKKWHAVLAIGIVKSDECTPVVQVHPNLKPMETIGPLGLEYKVNIGKKEGEKDTYLLVPAYVFKDEELKGLLEKVGTAIDSYFAKMEETVKKLNEQREEQETEPKKGGEDGVKEPTKQHSS